MFYGKKEIARLVHAFRGDGGDFECLFVNSVDYSEAVLARLVGGSGDDTAPVRRSAHDDGLAAIFRMISLLDAGVEGIQVEMQDRSCSFVHVPHGLSAVFNTVSLPLYQHQA